MVNLLELGLIHGAYCKKRREKQTDKERKHKDIPILLDYSKPPPKKLLDTLSKKGDPN